MVGVGASTARAAIRDRTTGRTLLIRIPSRAPGPPVPKRERNDPGEDVVLFVLK